MCGLLNHLTIDHVVDDVIMLNWYSKLLKQLLLVDNNSNKKNTLIDATATEQRKVDPNLKDRKEAMKR